MEKWIKINPRGGKGLLRQYPSSKLTKFGFGGWTSKLEEDDGYGFWVLVMNTTKKPNKKRHKLKDSHKQLLAAGVEFFSKTFTDTPKVWVEFSKKRMANNMNIFVLAIKKGMWIKKSGEEMTNTTSVLHNCPCIVIGCLTATVTDHYVVVNALAVRDDKLFVSLEDPSTGTKDAVDVTR